MNIINRGFLKLALTPTRLYEKVGVNTRQLKAILTTKLMMDDRRVGVFAQGRQRKKEKQVSAATIGTMVFSAIMGVVFMLALYLGNDIITQLTVYYSFFFFMLSLTLISDFTSVLIDVRDNFIILPKPVNDRTFVVARLLHIFIHISKIVLPMSIPGLILILSDYGIGGGLLFLLTVFMLTGFVIFCINSVYIIILKITTPQKFQAIISYIQIIFAIAVYGGYQIVPRVMGNIENFNIANQKGVMFFPLYWFANTWNVLYTFSGNFTQIIAAVLGVATPAVSLLVVVKYLAPSFNNKLALINTSGSAEQKKVSKVRRQSYSHFLSKIFTRTNAERMGFLFTWIMTSRSRDFKIKVYPAIGYLLVYVVIMFFNSKDMSLSEISEETQEGKIVIISAIYFTSFLLVMAINQIIYSDKYKASWIYYTSPLSKPGEVISGAGKAAILKFYIPMVVFITAAGLWLVGVRILPNIILGLINEILIAAVLVYAGNKMFPFSTHQSNSVKAGSFLRNLFVLAISGIIAIGHFLIYSILPAVAVCVVLSGIASWLIMDSIKNTSWQQIKSVYTED